MLFNFIWASKTDRISRNQIIKDYKDGGCRMVHLTSFVKSLKLSWIRRMFASEASWKCLFFTMFKTDQGKMESFGGFYAKYISRKFKNDFWNEVLHTFCKFDSIPTCHNANDILSSSIWYNDNIQVRGIAIFFKDMYAGFFYQTCDCTYFTP